MSSQPTGQFVGACVVDQGPSVEVGHQGSPLVDKGWSVVGHQGPPVVDKGRSVVGHQGSPVVDKGRSVVGHQGVVEYSSPIFDFWAVILRALISRLSSFWMSEVAEQLSRKKSKRREKQNVRFVMTSLLFNNWSESVNSRISIKA